MKTKIITSEYEVLECFRQKDERAINFLFKKYFRVLVYFSNKLLGDRLEAEDVTADTFIKLINHNKSFDKFSDIQGFLYTTAKNKCLDILKHRKVEKKADKELIYLMEKDECFINSKTTQAELLSWMLSEIENLPPARKKIFKMILAGMDNKEISAKLKISIETIRVQRFKVINYLRGKITNEP